MSLIDCGPDCSKRFWKGRTCGGVGCPGFKYPSNQVMKAGKSLLLPEPLFPHQQNWGDDNDEVDEVLGCCEHLSEGKAGCLAGGLPQCLC